MRPSPGYACLACAAVLAAVSSAGAASGAGTGQRTLSPSQTRAYQQFLDMGRIREFPPTPWSMAFSHEGRSYRVVTNTSPEVARFVGVLMDAQVDALRRVFRLDMTPSRITVWAFRTRKEFEFYGSQLINTEIAPNKGGFWTDVRGGMIVLPYLREGNLDPVKVLLHEASHQCLQQALNTTDVPMWLDEGLAVFFEESRYNPLTHTLELAYIPRDRLRLLQHEMRSGRHVTLTELVATTRDAFTVSHYGSAWSFIYWMLRSTDKKEALRRQKALNAYLFDIRAGRTDAQRLFAHIDMQPAQIESQWTDWVVALDINEDRGGTRMSGDASAVLRPFE
jgi:hypothetical protein